MVPPRLFCRRSILLPTLPGALLVLALVVGIAFFALRALPSFLAPNEPLGHGILVVEGWIPREALHLAAETFWRGGYERLVVSGGPVEEVLWSCDARTYAERAAAEMRLLGIVEPALVVVPAPASAQDRTYRSAVSVRQWIESSGRAVTALDVFTRGPHARRTRALYRMAFGDGVEVGVRSVSPSHYDLAHWWRRSDSAREVLTESIGYAWTLCCFHPGPRDSHEELWGQPTPRHP